MASSCHPASQGGAYRDRHERGGGMRWTRLHRSARASSGKSLPRTCCRVDLRKDDAQSKRADERCRCGRPSRVVLAPRRWRQVGDDASHHADDGGKRARSPGRARSKPLKPLRREGRTISAEPVVLPRAFFAARGPWVPAGARSSLRPLRLRVTLPQNSGAIRAARTHQAGDLGSLTCKPWKSRIRGPSRAFFGATRQTVAFRSMASSA
jgi:hypothetical protein